MTITIVSNRNGKKRISWGRAFLAFAFLNTVMELVAFGIVIKEGGKLSQILPFVCALALALSVMLIGFVYWLTRPVEQLPVFDVGKEQ